MVHSVKINFSSEKIFNGWNIGYYFIGHVSVQILQAVFSCSQQFRKETKIKVCQSKLPSRLALGFQHGAVAVKKLIWNGVNNVLNQLIFK